MLVSKIMLTTKLMVYRQSIQDLLQQIADIESDTQTSVEVRLAQIQKIREELNKIGAEIDNIKQAITLLETYEVN